MKRTLNTLLTVGGLLAFLIACNSDDTDAGGGSDTETPTNGDTDSASDAAQLGIAHEGDT